VREREIGKEARQPTIDHAVSLATRLLPERTGQKRLANARRTNNMMRIIFRRCGYCIGGTRSSAKSYRSPAANAIALVNTSSVDFQITRSASFRHGCSIPRARIRSAPR
jgi:hypothetical protein